MTDRKFQLAVYIHPKDRTGDRELLERHGWNPTHPWTVAATPEDYQNFISLSRAEISCCKPIFRELKTGWFSDRSACYLASGRPVVAEDTGFSDHIPVGEGLLAFHDIKEAAAAVREVDADYNAHVSHARAVAEEFFDYRKVIPDMLSACI